MSGKPLEGIAREITTNPVACQVLKELHQLLYSLTADFELVFAVGSWGAGLSDEDILERLRKWNKEHPALRTEDAPPHPHGPVPAGHRALLTGKPAVAVEAVDEVTAAIIQQLYEALTALEADSKLLGVVGSWRDTLPDLHVLAGLRAWNAQRTVIVSHFWSAERESEVVTTVRKGGQPS